MTQRSVVGAAVSIAAVLVVLTLVARIGAPRGGAPASATARTSGDATTATEASIRPDFLYGRITTTDEKTYEGRIRWGQDQEAFWTDYFNGTKSENPWEVHATEERPSGKRRIEIFGLEFGGPDRTAYRRLFLARFGDIARIEAHVRDVQVTLKSGTLFTLDRFAAGDIDDGVRVWDARRGMVDVGARQIRTVQFLAPAPSAAVNVLRLHGTVHTRQGDFTGFIQWNQRDVLSTDELTGRTGDSEVSVGYDGVRSIARRSRDSVVVTRLDGSELVLSNSPEVGRGHRGVNVDDNRYGRVLVTWSAFERVDFSPGNTGPAYGDFPPGRPLTGNITTREGRRLSGRLVYDFDESETTETLDASTQGVDYNIPFSLIAGIVANNAGTGGGQRVVVMLRSGEELQLDRAGDLGDRNAGVLVFAEGQEHPERVLWTDVARIDFK